MRCQNDNLHRSATSGTEEQALAQYIASIAVHKWRLAHAYFAEIAKAVRARHEALDGKLRQEIWTMIPW